MFIYEDLHGILELAYNALAPKANKVLLGGLKPDAGQDEIKKAHEDLGKSANHLFNASTLQMGKILSYIP